MKYIVYLTINLVNNKIYIGVHKTEDPNIFDGYIGCGVNIFEPSTYKKSKTTFQYAVNKYGIKNFKRVVLKIFESELDAYKEESVLVNEDFIKRPDTYNMTLGGKRGTDQSKVVYQYDLSGNFLKEWSSHFKAATFYKCSETSINNAVTFKYSSCGFFWSNEKVEMLDLTVFSKTKRNEKIYEYTSVGDFITSYLSTEDISKKYNVSIGEINRGIQGKYKVANHYFSLEKMDKFNFHRSKSIKNKPIYLYDFSGKFFKQFSSPIECAKEFGLKTSSEISSALRLGRLFRGYQVSIEKLPYMKKHIPKNGQIVINQYDLSGKFVKTFNSLSEAIKEFGTGVRKVLKGQQKQCKGYIFKKVNDIV